MAVTLAARRVLRPDGTLGPGDVVLEGGHVAAVLDDPGPDPPDRTLSPGLIDLQVNGLGRWDVWNGDLAPLGAAWWLLCRPSPAVIQASHWLLVDAPSYGRVP